MFQTNFTYRDMVEFEYLDYAIPSASIILDVGCGNGRVNDILYKKAHRIVGIDTSIDVLRLANKRLDGGYVSFDLIQADAKYLPFRNFVFPVVLFLGTFVYFPEIMTAISEAARVSIDSAVTVFNLFNKKVHPLRRFINETRSNLKSSRVANRDRRRGVYYDPNEITESLALEGYRVVCVEGLFAIMPADVGVIEHILTKLHMKAHYSLFRLFARVNRKISRMRTKYLLCADLIYTAIKT